MKISELQKDINYVLMYLKKSGKHSFVFQPKGQVSHLEANGWVIVSESEIKNKEIQTPKHYDNSKGTLYKVAEERGWNPYLFDIVKRLERANKKGEFETDLKKSIAVIELWLAEHEQITRLV